MIKALLLRRIWLLGNNLTSGIVILFLFPLTIFIFTNLAFRKIPVVGIYDVDFDIWIYPSMIFLVTGLSILPSIFISSPVAFPLLLKSFIEVVLLSLKNGPLGCLGVLLHTLSDFKLLE